MLNKMYKLYASSFYLADISFYRFLYRWLPLPLALSRVFVQRRAAQFLIKRRQSLIKLVRYFRRYFSVAAVLAPPVTDPLPSSDPSKSKSLVSSRGVAQGQGRGWGVRCSGRESGSVGDCVMILDSIKFLEFPLKCQA